MTSTGGQVSKAIGRRVGSRVSEKDHRSADYCSQKEGRAHEWKPNGFLGFFQKTEVTFWPNNSKRLNRV